MAQSITTAATIAIHKMAGAKKDAVRITTEADIPDFLFGTVAIDPFMGELVLTCVEGEERCPLGSVIAYEPSDSTVTGWNAWNKANWRETLEEIDGVFYEKAVGAKPPVYQAQEVTEEFPEFLRGADIVRNADGSWSIKTDWGVSTGFPGGAYWVRYGEKEKELEDGTKVVVPDANILTKTEKSFRDYVVSDADGNDICSLPEWDARAHA